MGFFLLELKKVLLAISFDLKEHISPFRGLVDSEIEREK